MQYKKLTLVRVRLLTLDTGCARGATKADI